MTVLMTDARRFLYTRYGVSLDVDLPIHDWFCANDIVPIDAFGTLYGYCGGIGKRIWPAIELEEGRAVLHS